MQKKKNALAGCLAAAGLLFVMIFLSSSGIKQPGIKRTELQRHDLSVPGRESIQSRIDFAPGTRFGKHLHPGEEIIYVLEGVLEYEVENMPPITLNAGGVLFIPAGTIHSAKNTGNSHAIELATYIIEKGKPAIVMK